MGISGGAGEWEYKAAGGAGAGVARILDCNSIA